MARYVEKSQEDLDWNEIRREVTAMATLAAANWKERQLNKVLPRLQREYEEALQQGKVLKLEPGDVTFEDD